MDKAIYFDMDGTLADLYGQENWLKRLREYDPTPYATAEPLINIRALKLQLTSLKAVGWTIGIISWLSKDSPKDYSMATRRAKREWLNKYFGKDFFDEVHLVKYGTPKHRVAKVRKGFLVDDNCEVCIKWENYGGRAIQV